MNNDLWFDGKRFISVSRASELTGYTQDYLGQLCRGQRVPAKIVGRTWYIEEDAVVAHKEHPTSRKAKRSHYQERRVDNQEEKKHIAPQAPTEPTIAREFFRAQEQPSYTSPFTYKKDFSPMLPRLRKVSGERVESARKSSLLPLAAVGLFIFALVSWLPLISPRATEFAMHAIRNEVSRGALLSATTAATKSAVKSASEGLVVFPDPVRHDQAVSAVENSFSDGAEVDFDSNGTSGVIKPVFSSGTGSTSYAFVMVPINKK